MYLKIYSLIPDASLDYHFFSYLSWFCGRGYGILAILEELDGIR